MNVFSLLCFQLHFFIEKEQMMMRTFQYLDLVFLWRSTKESGKCSTQISSNITAYIAKITHLSFKSEKDVRKGQITQSASQTKLEGDERWLRVDRGLNGLNKRLHGLNERLNELNERLDGNLDVWQNLIQPLIRPIQPIQPVQPIQPIQPIQSLIQPPFNLSFNLKTWHHVQ